MILLEIDPGPWALGKGYGVEVAANMRERHDFIHTDWYQICSQRAFEKALGVDKMVWKLAEKSQIKKAEDQVFNSSKPASLTIVFINHSHQSPGTK